MDDWAQIVDAMGDGAVVIDTHGRYAQVNESFLGLTGYDRDRLVGAELGLVHDEATVERIERAIEPSDRSNDAAGEITGVPLETAAGSRRFVDITVSPLSDEDGTFRGIVCVVREAADRERPETEPPRYERELERYEHIVEVMGDGVYAIGPDGRYTMANDYLLELLGIDRDVIRGAEPSLIHDDAEIEIFDAAIESLLRDGGGVETVEITLETADGREIPVEVNLTLLPSEDGEYRGTVGVIRDITDRKRRERELEQYERLIEATGDAVYALDPEGRFTFSNQAHQDIVDRDESELLGTHASISLPDEAVDGGSELIGELLSSDRRCGTYEMDILRPNGELIRTENHIALLTDDDGSFRGTIGVLRDITERKRRERELRRQNERLEQFASVVTHDLRNPLNVAQGYLDGIDDPAVEAVDESLERMAAIIDEVLELARQGRTIDEPAPVSLPETVRAAWETVETGETTLIVDTAETIRADRNRLLALFENLFRNSIEHAAADEVRVGTDAGADFYVVDDGPGVPADERDAIFDMGYTTDRNGTGFGLAIVAEIAAAHGWDVSVTDGRDGGARFEFTGVERSSPRH